MSNEKMWKKNHIAILMGCVFFLLIAGCGKNTTTTIPDKDSSNTSTKNVSTEVGAEQQTGAEQPTGDEQQTGAEPNPDAASTPTEIVRSTAEDLPKAKPKPSGPELISFDDLKLGMDVDVKFHPRMLQINDGRAKELFGQRVIVAGYMDPDSQTITGSKPGEKAEYFVLLRNLECKFGPGGQADHLVRVFLAEDEVASFTDKVVYVEGELTFHVHPEDPQAPITYSIYDMINSKVSTRRPSRAR